MKNRNNRGLTVVELLVAVAIITVFITSIAYSYSAILRLAFNNTLSIKAAFLLEDTVEAVKFLKRVSWQNNIAVLDSDQDYFLSFTGSGWEVVSENIFIDGVFERKFILEDVNRDSDGRVVESPSGTLDAGTKKLTAYVSWQKSSATTTRSITTYLSDI
ncbi:MAG: prepilin-type N-terminal cleavage/methylation domain-containing protein [Candidatus Paceibacterota bacterium]|nr:MAG: prepilin-type N-terminal cleavage/methylation domain-containing protein [Candidatus Paceibacterota bacterium]